VKKTVSAIASLLLLLAMAAHSQEPGRIESAVQAWADAYNSHDPARVVARYHPEAAFWGTTSPTLRTTPADVAEYFAGLARRPNAQVSFGEKTVRIVGDVAIVTGHYTFTDVANGEAVSRPAESASDPGEAQKLREDAERMNQQLLRMRQDYEAKIERLNNRIRELSNAAGRQPAAAEPEKKGGFFRR